MKETKKHSEERYEFSRDRKKDNIGFRGEGDSKRFIGIDKTNLIPKITQRPIRETVECPLYRTEVSPDTCMACYYYQKPHDTENIFPFDMRKHLEQRTIPCSLPDLIPKRNTDHEIEDITGKYFRRETIPFIKKP